MYLEDDSPWGVKRIYHGIAFQELLIVISLMHEMDITSLMSKIPQLRISQRSKA